jgi:DNA-binding LytR/AlgR family response regulator
MRPSNRKPEGDMNQLLLHLSKNRYRVIDAASVYYLEATTGDTLVRRRRARPLRDTRQLGAIMRSWKRAGPVRVHRNHAVNPEHVLEIRRRAGSRYWEVKLAPPVNKILPVSRNYLKDLLAAFGER